MRLGILSESPADEAALEVLLRCLPLEGLQRESSFRGRKGWPGVRDVTPAVIKALYYGTQAEGLVIVVDSDDTRPHHADHTDPTKQGDCRACEMASVVRVELGNLTPVHGRASFLVAVGLAVPAIEAWYLCGEDHQVNEAAWINGQLQGVEPYSRLSLKEALYGVTRIPLDVAISKAEEAATRLCGDDLSRLEQDFPVGFRMLLADEVRGWQSDAGELLGFTD